MSGVSRGIKGDSARNQSPREDCAPGLGARIVIVAKAPGPDAKTRLAGALTPPQRALLVEAMLEDTVDAARDASARLGAQGIRGELCLAVGDCSAPFFTVLARRRRIHLIEQGEGNLGRKLIRVFSTSIRERPAWRHLVIGSDGPSLPTDFLTQAFHALDDHDLVLGPAMDGGYYLIGASVLFPELFTDIPWSTSRVFASTLERAAALGLKTARLPLWFDVDHPADLDRIRDGLGPPAVRAEPGSARRTRDLLVRFAIIAQH